MGTNYKVVLLDMDGTFLDSRGVGDIPNEWAYEAFKKTLRHYGITLTIDEINNLFLAPLHADGEEGVIRFCDRFGFDCEEFWRRREKDVIEAKIEAIGRGVIKLCKGSEEIIRYLSKRFYLAVVSDSQQACVNYALEYFNLKPYFALWFGRRSELESLAKRKPNPFYINEVLRELRMRKEEAILVDDSPIGILAAKNAGIDSVLIRSEEISERRYEYEPTFLVKNIGELRKVL
jgi:HAD superfamily hydrolase (TIGR01509 family)